MLVPLAITQSGGCERVEHNTRTGSTGKPCLLRDGSGEMKDLLHMASVGPTTLQAASSE